MNLETLLPPRLRDWYNAGPVQQAELQEFADALLRTRAVGTTADGYFAEPGDQVWILNGVGTPTPTTVQKPQALTNYTLFGPVPVAHAWMDRQALERYLRDR